MVLSRFVQALLVMLAATLVVQQVSADDLHDGEWELQVRQSVPGMPAGVAEFRWRECLSDGHPVPTMYLQASSCDVLSQHTVYHTLHYRLSCFGEHGTFTNEGQLHFDRMRLTGKSKSDTGSVDGQAMVMRYGISGQRIGDCE